MSEPIVTALGYSLGCIIAFFIKRPREMANKMTQDTLLKHWIVEGLIATEDRKLNGMFLKIIYFIMDILENWLEIALIGWLFFLFGKLDKEIPRYLVQLHKFQTFIAVAICVLPGILLYNSIGMFGDWIAERRAK